MYPRPITRRKPLGSPTLFSQAGADVIRLGFTPRMYAEGLASLAGCDVRPRLSGLGDEDMSTTGSIVGGGIEAGGAVAGALISGENVTQKVVLSAPTIVGGVLTSPAVWGAAAVPVVGAVVAGVTIALMAWMNRKGPKQKTMTTQIVNDLEPLLEENVQGYLSGPRTRASQAQAIQNFQAVWSEVLRQCGDPSMGEPGRRCIAERQEGAHPQWDACAPDCPNWFQLYLDPIRNDTEVKPNPAIEDTFTQSLTSDLGLDIPVGGSLLDAKVAGFPIVLIGAGLLLLFGLSDSGSGRRRR